MKSTIVETLLISVFAAAGSTFTAHEQVAVCGLAAAGAGLGAVFGTLLSNIFTGPGLEKLTQTRRMAVNWILGFSVAFVSSWWIRDHWVESYPPEVIAGGIGFILASCGVCVIALLWPVTMVTLRNVGYKWGARAATKQINAAPPDSPDGNFERRGGDLASGPSTVYLSSRPRTTPRD